MSYVPLISTQSTEKEKPLLGTVQNLWGNRAGFKNRGAKSFFGCQKGGAETFFDERNVGACTFFH